MPDGVTVTPKTTLEPTTQGFVKDETNPIAGFLGLENVSDTDSQALKDIYDFVRGDSKEMTELEMLHKVRELEQKLGLTSLGERRVDKMHRWVKLQSQIDNLVKSRDREMR